MDFPAIAPDGFHGLFTHSSAHRGFAPVWYVSPLRVWAVKDFPALAPDGF